jgi:hypothetical protein
MPFLEGPFAFTGKLDMLSAYRMRGVDKIVVRRKGGPSREKIKTGESFENTRRTMSEFGGCSRLGSYVRMALTQIRHLSDYNFGSDINSVMRQVQLRDGTSEWGRRRITLSEHPRLLEGFSTTKKAPTFDSVVRAPVYYTMNRRDRSVRVDIPELLRDINYFPRNNHAMFRLTITLGIVPDVTFDVPSKEYLPPTWYNHGCNSIEASTDWSPSLEGMQRTTLALAMDELPPDDSWTLMLSIGIEYGAFRRNGKIEEVPRFGAAKIMALEGKDGISDDSDDDNRNGENEEYSVEPETEAVTIPDNLPAVESQPKPTAVDSPELRYVYTMKVAASEKQETRVYGYTVPVAVREDVRHVNAMQRDAPLYGVPVDVPVALDVSRDAVKSYVGSGRVSEDVEAHDKTRQASGSRDSIRRYHRGYWSVEHAVDFFQESQRALFTQAVHQLLRNISSENYSLNKDGPVSIHIEKREKTTTVLLTCRAEWFSDTRLSTSSRVFEGYE